MGSMQRVRRDFDLLFTNDDHRCAFHEHYLLVLFVHLVDEMVDSETAVWIVHAEVLHTVHQKHIVIDYA